uniref:Secreted protein n=1 Tax=Lutzomyia longipalpis TaxID=7200 RepID=A0A7G3B6Z7_LUTLO
MAYNVLSLLCSFLVGFSCVNGIPAENKWEIQPNKLSTYARAIKYRKCFRRRHFFFSFNFSFLFFWPIRRFFEEYFFILFYTSN